MISEASLLTYKDEKVKEITEKYSPLLDKKLAKIEEDKNASLYNLSDQETINKITKKYELKTQKAHKWFDRKIKSIEKSADNHVKEVKAASKRIFEVDLLRGIIILGMIVDHLIYDFANRGLFNMILDFNGYQSPALGWVKVLSDFSTWFYDSDPRVAIRLAGIAGLFLITGISSRFSKNNIRRSLIIFIIGTLMTLAFDLYSIFKQGPTLEPFIILGTIQCIGLCLLIYNGLKLAYIAIYNLILRRIHHKKNKEGEYKKDNMPISWGYISLGVFIVTAIMWFFISMNTYLSSPLTPFEIAHGMDASNNHTISDFWRYSYLIYNGDGNHVGWDGFGLNQDFETYGFLYFVRCVLGYRGFGNDWLGIFPSLSFLFLGGFIGEVIYKDKKSIIYRFYSKEERMNENPFESKPGQLNLKLNMTFRFITIPGKHTFLVYLLHQPVITVIFVPIFLLCGATLSL